MLAYNLKEIRKKKGMTKKQLSIHSGVSKSMICAIETEQRNPTIPILFSLAKALKVEISELMNSKEKM